MKNESYTRLRWPFRRGQAALAGLVLFCTGFAALAEEQNPALGPPAKAPDTTNSPLSPQDLPAEDSCLTVPLGGNTWKSPRGRQGARVATEGITGWSGTDESFSTYVRFARKGSLRISLDASVPEGQSVLELSIGNKRKRVTLREGDPKRAYAGEWALKDTGYVAIRIRGISRTGKDFANVRSLCLEGSAVSAQTFYTKNNEGNYFYWGRRGPSVHLSYPVPEHKEAEWFYSEVTVPEGEDVLGSYFMANGFAEGYFGFQVNSPTERRILFSVWSPFATDDPREIPEHQRIRLLSKGEGVYTGEFGNEGSGGQSYLRYPWKAGETYRFLLRGRPDGKGNTSYTAYFYAPEEGAWKLIASFLRPETDTWLRRLHSFLENFNPETGNAERRALFGNQWYRDTDGNWTELTRARFTGDNTARKQFRLDYAGGVKGSRFYLRNCGFFSDYTPLDRWLERPATGKQPAIDLGALEQ